MADADGGHIVNGSVTRALIVLSLPLVAQNLVQVANLVIDIFWLGRLGSDAVAGVGLVIPLISVLYTLLFTAMVGTQVIVSQRTGDLRHPAARRAAFNGVLLALALGALVGGVVFGFARPLAGVLDPAPSITSFAVAYLATYAAGLPLFYVADTVEAALVGAGDSRGSFYLNAVAVVLNAGLDPVLIFGLGPAPALGVRGAVIAQLIGYAVGLLLAIGLLRRGRKGLRLTRDALTIDLGDVREIGSVGLPNAGQNLGRDAVRVLMVGIVSTVGGPPGLAAYTVGARVASVTVLPARGLQQAAQSVVGQNLGADRPDRAFTAVRAGIALAGGVLLIVAALQWLGATPITAVFLPNASPVEAALAVDYLRILAYGYPAIGATYLLLAGFNGARRTRTSMVLTLIQYWGVRLPVAAGGAFLLGLGVHAVFWGVTISNLAAAVGAGVYCWHVVRGGMFERAADRASTRSSQFG